MTVIDLPAASSHRGDLDVDCRRRAARPSQGGHSERAWCAPKRVISRTGRCPYSRGRPYVPASHPRLDQPRQDPDADAFDPRRGSRPPLDAGRRPTPSARKSDRTTPREPRCHHERPRKPGWRGGRNPPAADLGWVRLDRCDKSGAPGTFGRSSVGLRLTRHNHHHDVSGDSTVSSTTKDRDWVPAMPSPGPRPDHR
jgi:hypothetical protein